MRPIRRALAIGVLVALTVGALDAATRATHEARADDAPAGVVADPTPTGDAEPAAQAATTRVPGGGSSLVGSAENAAANAAAGASGQRGSEGPELRAAPPGAEIVSSDPNLTSSESEGRKALTRAQEYLKQAESTHDAAAQKKAYELGKEQAERAVTLLPNDAEAHFLRFATTGRLAQLQGLAVAGFHLVGLQKELDRVLELDPNHADALAARGGMLVKLPRLLGGDTEKGIVYLEKAVKLDDTAVGKRLELSEAYHLVGRDQDAREMAEQGLMVAERIQNPEKIDTAKRFMEELAKSCSRCAIASIGR